MKYTSLNFCSDKILNVESICVFKSYEGELKFQTEEVKNLPFLGVSALPHNIFKPIYQRLKNK